MNIKEQEKFARRFYDSYAFVLMETEEDFSELYKVFKFRCWREDENLSNDDIQDIWKIVVGEYVKDGRKGKFDNYVVVNPKIVSSSDEMIAAEAGEGCLSVNRDVEGHVKRHARVTVEGYDVDGNKIRIRAREELAIAFQHEIDHLNGEVFIDKIIPGTLEIITPEEK